MLTGGECWGFSLSPTWGIQMYTTKAAQPDGNLCNGRYVGLQLIPFLLGFKYMMTEHGTAIAPLAYLGVY
jgi:hypothetical protein